MYWPGRDLGLNATGYFALTLAFIEFVAKYLVIALKVVSDQDRVPPKIGFGWVKVVRAALWFLALIGPLSYVATIWPN